MKLCLPLTVTTLLLAACAGPGTPTPQTSPLHLPEPQAQVLVEQFTGEGDGLVPTFTAAHYVLRIVCSGGGRLQVIYATFENEPFNGACNGLTTQFTDTLPMSEKVRLRVISDPTSTWLARVDSY